jgi:hypothetical protein
MNAPTIWSRAMVIVGLAGMLIGAIDPLEGSIIILPSAGLVALGAFLGKSRRRNLLYWSFALTAVGVAALFVLSWFGGVGGPEGHSTWWAVVLIPYPIGWMMGLVGGMLALVESFKYHAAPQ